MRKFFTTLVAGLVMVSVFTLAGCGARKTYEFALITDVGTIDDRSFNQGAWEGLKAYGDEHEVTYKYYQPKSQSTDDYIKAINLAVKNGAKYVVTPGYLFENAIYVSQTKHPNVKFILLDGSPHNVADWDTGALVPKTGNEPDFTIKDNVASILYAEEESGFYAGYAAVKEGYTNLGFMGGIAVPAVARFGYGYIAGAYYAALEEGIETLSVKYSYLNSFAALPAHQTKAAGWYTDGTDVIFASAGGAGNSIMSAAEAANKKVIGVDVDQKGESTTVLTSAIKNLKGSVITALERAVSEDPTVGPADDVRFGASVTLNSKVDGVGLPADFSRFTTFTVEQYNAIYAKIVAGEIVIPNDSDVDSATDVVAKFKELNTFETEATLTVTLVD